MRRTAAAMMGIAFGMVAGSGIRNAEAQEMPPYHRPQGKIISCQAPAETPAAIAVLGQVRTPGTYQFPVPPTLKQAVETAQGLTPAASPMIRIVRGQRVALRAAYPASGQEKLQANDLVIIDPQPVRDGTAPEPRGPVGVQVAMLGVLERPIVVTVHPSRARADLIVQMLGQTTPPQGIIPPPHMNRAALPMLADGTVLVFDPRRIQVADLPDDLPKVLPCQLEEPDLGAYGIRRAIGERAGQDRRLPPGAGQAMPAPRRESATTNDLVPLPAPDVPTTGSLPRIAEDPRVEATLSSGDKMSAPISTIPFAKAPTEAKTVRLTETAPVQTNAADAREPAWNQVAEPKAKPDQASHAEVDDEFDAASDESAKGSFTLGQMAMILSSAGLLVGVGLIVRHNQNQAEQRKTKSSGRRENQPEEQSGGMARQPHATIPPPHLPLSRLRQPSAQIPSLEGRTMASPPETAEMRQQRFDQLLRSELPVVEEPLALRPGLRILAAGESPSILLADSAQNASRQPLRKDAASADEASGAAARQIIDEPHRQRMPAPHHRIGAEAPVERALRQLQGGRS